VREVAITLDDERLVPLRELMRQFDITIIAGAPIACPEGKPYIGALTLNSDNSHVYRKQHLHPGEEDFFSPSPNKKGCVVDVKGVSVGVAICADINHASHAEEAARNGASIYIAGVLITDSGYSTDTQQLQHYATEHAMTVLMANHGSPTGGYIPAGKSAIWAHSGKLLATTDGTGNALVLAAKDQGKWTGRTLTI
jgi:predicted amidohydrolase